MADREDEDLQMALRMSLHGSPPEAKRSKPIEISEESAEARDRRLQRELRAAAAEKRISMMMRSPVSASPSPTASPSKPAENKRVAAEEPQGGVIQEQNRNLAAPGAASARFEEAGQAVERVVVGKREVGGEDFGEELSPEMADQLFFMLFGNSISKGILAQWSNQGIRFSSDPETCIGLVQHEGGPCGVLAALQAYVLKSLIFFPDELDRIASGSAQHNLAQRRSCQNSKNTLGDFTSINVDVKRKALVLSMVEILFLCGRRKNAAVVALNLFRDHSEEGSEDGQKNEKISKALESLTIESASDLQRLLRVSTCRTKDNAFHRLIAELPVYQSRMGVLLFLISALLSRGLDSIQADRDDPSLPLVTAPFGHASQEIVNLLLCGEAAPNVFDGRMDLGGGMFLKGIPANVEVGFLTLLESLNFCKVGQYLKCPKWPIWVVGSESHYTVLFALDTAVQDENELEERESRIRRAFNEQDQSGGGGFISVEGFHQVLRETNINLPSEKIDSLCSTGYIVWSEFWQVLLDLDKSLGGLKDSAGLGKKQFDIYHFNGIAKSVTNGSQATGSETPVQRPRLCKLSVSVPPRWTQEEFMADMAPSSSNGPGRNDGNPIELNQLPEPAQHAALVDCIRTRWPRAICNWVGDPPSIV